MRKDTIVLGFFLVIVCGLLIVFSPDGLSMIFVIAQAILMLLGYIFGIFKVSRYSKAFQFGRLSIHGIKKEISAEDIWLPIVKHEDLFLNDDMDSEFDVYKSMVAESKKQGNGVLPDVENVFNEDMLSIRTWRSIINQIPETLTGIGILGTFVGLIIGVGGIGFSSVAAAITSLQVLINGIEIAFYTSIVGIILSICFNMAYKFYWNILLREMFLFVDDFHRMVIPSEEEQMRDLESKYYTTMLKICEEKEKQEN